MMALAAFNPESRSLLLLTAFGCAVLLGGCVSRWEAPTSGLARPIPACPYRIAPAVRDFGDRGVRGAYQFVTQGASDEQLGSLIRQSEAAGFGLALVTVNLNGFDTVFAMGRNVLRTQADVDAEFRHACDIGERGIYLTHVRYNPAAANAEQIRVR